jgi:hypothetical protein
LLRELLVTLQQLFGSVAVFNCYIEWFFPRSVTPRSCIAASSIEAFVVSSYRFVALCSCIAASNRQSVQLHRSFESSVLAAASQLSSFRRTVSSPFAAASQLRIVSPCSCIAASSRQSLQLHCSFCIAAFAVSFPLAALRLQALRSFVAPGTSASSSCHAALAARAASAGARYVSATRSAVAAGVDRSRGHVHQSDSPAR